MSRTAEVEVVAATSVAYPGRSRRTISRTAHSNRNTRRVEHDATHRKQTIATMSTRHSRETSDCTHLRGHSHLTALGASPRIGTYRAEPGVAD
jgi:hypothetical protein